MSLGADATETTLPTLALERANPYRKNGQDECACLISGFASTTYAFRHGRDSRISIQTGNIPCQNGYGGLIHYRNKGTILMRLPISGSALTTHVLIHGPDRRIPIQMGNISCQRGYGGLPPNETRSVA